MAARSTTQVLREPLARTAPGATINAAKDSTAGRGREERGRGGIAGRFGFALDGANLALGAIIVATTVACAPGLRNHFLSDDLVMIVANRFIGQWSFLWKSMVHDVRWFIDLEHLPQSAYYRPMQDIWFALLYHLFGFNAAGWHLGLVALHLLAVLLSFKIAAHLTGDRLAGILAAALFALIPVHAEAVAWAGGSDFALAAVPVLGAFYLLISRAEARRVWLNWALALILYALAMMSHESAAAFPGLVGLYGFLLEPTAAPQIARRAGAIRARTRRAILLMAPFAAELLVYFAARTLVLGSFSVKVPDNRMTGAQALMTMPLAVLSYLKLLAAPWMAGPAHPISIVMSPASPGFFLPIIALLAATGLFLLIVRGDPSRRLYLFSAGWLAFAMAPMMNLPGLFPNMLVQDRYLYVASLGWCVMLGDVAARAARRWEQRKEMVWCALALVFATCAAVFFNTVGFWHDSVTEFTRAVHSFPESPDWHRLLGVALLGNGDPTEAERELRTALDLDPKDSDALYYLGLVHVRFGRLAQGAGELIESQRLGGRSPGPYIASVYALAATIYDSAGGQKQSEAALKYAESLPEGKRAADLARADIKLAHHDAQGAETILRGLAHSSPELPRVWISLGVSMALQNRDDEALADFNRAIALSPNDPIAHAMTARLLHRMRRDDEALAHRRIALAVARDDPRVRELLSEMEHGAPASDKSAGERSY